MNQINNIPNNISSYVMKAITYLNSEDGVTFASICKEVNLQMKNTIPVSNLNTFVRKSLESLIEDGIIQAFGHTRFSICRLDENRNKLNNPKTIIQIFQRDVKTQSSKEELQSKLDPNRKRKHVSDDELSGDDVDRHTKRRAVRKIPRSGRIVPLPGVKRVHQSEELFAFDNNFLRDFKDNESCEVSSLYE